MMGNKAFSALLPIIIYRIYNYKFYVITKTLVLKKVLFENYIV